MPLYRTFGETQGFCDLSDLFLLKIERHNDLPSGSGEVRDLTAKQCALCLDALVLELVRVVCRDGHIVQRRMLISFLSHHIAGIDVFRDSPNIPSGVVQIRQFQKRDVYLKHDVRGQFLSLLQIECPTHRKSIDLLHIFVNQSIGNLFLHFNFPHFPFCLYSAEMHQKVGVILKNFSRE